MTLTTLDVLKQARDIYAAAPSHARSCTEIAPGTNCVLTAIYYVSGPVDVRKRAEQSFREIVRVPFVGQWNADNTTEVVLEAWDRVIAVVAEHEGVEPLPPLPETPAELASVASNQSETR